MVTSGSKKKKKKFKESLFSIAQVHMLLNLLSNLHTKMRMKKQPQYFADEYCNPCQSKVMQTFRFGKPIFTTHLIYF